MNEFRCHNCNSLLYKAEGDIEVEVICQKCRRINYPSRKDECLGLRGKDFQIKAIDHLCKKCQRLLFRSIGLGRIETKCKYCKTLSSFDTTSIRSGKNEQVVFGNELDKKYRESLAR